MACSPGSLGQIAIDTSGSFSGTSWAFEILGSESMKFSEVLAGHDHIRGSLTRFTETTRIVQQSSSGSFTTPMSPKQADRLATLVSGDGSSPYTPTNTPTSFALMVDRGVEQYVYASCRIDTLTFRGQAGGIAQMEASIVGGAETTGTWSAEAFGETAIQWVPLAFSDFVFTFDQGGLNTTYAIESFEIVISNNIDVRFTNSLTPTDYCAQDRVVSLSITGSMGNLSNPAQNLYSESIATPKAIRLKGTNGGVSVQFDFPKCHIQRNTPNISGRQDIKQTVTWDCLGSGTGANEYSITTDITP